MHYRLILQPENGPSLAMMGHEGPYRDLDEAKNVAIGMMAILDWMTRLTVYRIQIFAISNNQVDPDPIATVWSKYINNH